MAGVLTGCSILKPDSALRVVSHAIEEIGATAELAGLEIGTGFVLGNFVRQLIRVIITTITTSMSTFHIEGLELVTACFWASTHLY